MNLRSLSIGHPVVLAFVWYCSGLAMGALFWKYFLLKIGFEVVISTILGLSTAAFLAIGCTFSTQMRCTLLLIGLAAFGKAGRIVLRTLLLSLILSGPISNLSHNTEEIIRVFACATSLTFNLTRNRFDLMTKPFQNAILGLHDNMTSFKDNFQNLEDVFEAIVEEVEGDDPPENKTRRSPEADPKYYEDRYRKKLKTRCQQQLAKGLAKCKDTFSDAYDQCYEKLPVVVNTLLCWPVQISSICDFSDEFGFGSEEDSFCDPKGVVDEGFGRNYVELKRMETEFMGNFSDADLEFNFSANQDTIEAME
jgi:E3 ubiquitin-protein ligase DCST1